MNSCLNSNYIKRGNSWIGKCSPAGRSPERRGMGVRGIAQKEFFANEERFADLVNAICFRGREIVRPEELITEPESVRKADEMEALDRESKFFLATMLGQKKLRKEC